MPSVTTDEILAQVNDQLNDVGYIRWPKAELLSYFNFAQKAVVLRRPDAFMVDIDDFVCVEGTKQTLPVDALRLIDVPANASGDVIRGPYDKNTLDNNYPSWRGGKTATEAELYLYDERNPKTFYLYPGVVAGVQVNVIHSAAPPRVSMAENDGGKLIDLDDIYENALTEWILYRCYSKDAEFAANPQKAQTHLNAFKAQLGEKSQADGAVAGQPIKE